MCKLIKKYEKVFIINDTHKAAVKKQAPRKVINELIKCQRHFGNHKGDYKDKVPKLSLLTKYK